METYEIVVKDEPNPHFVFSRIPFEVYVHHFDGDSFVEEITAMELLVRGDVFGEEDHFIRNIGQWSIDRDRITFVISDADIEAAENWISLVEE